MPAEDTPRGNIARALAELAVRHPARLAIADSATRLTFSELAESVARVAGGLTASGVQADDRVLVFVPMSGALYTTLLGTLHAGAVAVFVDAWARRARLEAAVAAAGPEAFIGTRRAQLLRLFSREVRRIPHHFTPSGAAFRNSSPVAVVDVAPSAPALVTFTTGSTGRPKAAERTHRFLWAQHHALAAHLQLREDDVDMPTLPIFVLNNLALGVTSVIPDMDPRRPARIDPARIFRQLRQSRVTTSSGSPAFYERLAAWCEGHQERLPMRAIFTGGAPVLPPLARRLREVSDGVVHVVYGSTEAEPIAGITADEMVELSERGEGVCVGQPVADIALRLIRPHDDAIVLGASGWLDWDVDAGEPGEIVVAGDHVLTGYLGDPAAEARTKIRDGDRIWHRTGDAARLDGEGRLWLLGRVRERVLRDGTLWWPLPAEVRALRCDGVTHAAYLGAASATMGQRAVLCVECDPNRADERFRRSVLAAVDPWPVDELKVVRRIPRDPRHASKTDSERLRAMLGTPA